MIGIHEKPFGFNPAHPSEAVIPEGFMICSYFPIFDDLGNQGDFLGRGEIAVQKKTFLVKGKSGFAGKNGSQGHRANHKMFLTL